MNFWLVKSEPGTYSWDRLVKEKKAVWDGVRNFAARNNLKAMKKGDQCFFYHSNEGKDIVGIAEVVKESYPEPGADDPNWVAVDIKPVKKLKRSVTLAEMKADKRLANLELVRISRLSVSKVSKAEYETILSLSEK